MKDLRERLTDSVRLMTIESALAELHTMERLESFVSGTRGKRLTYKALIQ